MKMFLKENVWDAAIERLGFIFDEFDNVIISTSGGKDSTVLMELALIVAELKDRLPVKLFFLDQEAEYRMVVEYMRKAMSDPRVEPLWLQCPIKLFNATSADDPWLMCWAEGDEWMRQKEDISIKENVFGTDRFHKIFSKVIDYYFPDQKACYLSGVRAEESPSRLGALTTSQTYKHITYGKRLTSKNVPMERGHYTFFPLYDWHLSDIWKAIHSNGWQYCQVYDEFYRYGVKPHEMRVSNLHHETAVHHLFRLHEIEADTWEALTKRLKGVNQAKHIIKNEMLGVHSLPFMFKDWKEYRDYLTENLIVIPDHIARFKKKWEKMDEKYAEMRHLEDLYRKQIGALLVNDWEFVKLSSFENKEAMICYRNWKRGKKWNKTNEVWSLEKKYPQNHSLRYVSGPFPLTPWPVIGSEQYGDNVYDG